MERKPAWNLLGFEAARADGSGAVREIVESSSVEFESLLLRVRYRGIAGT